MFLGSNDSSNFAVENDLNLSGVEEPNICNSGSDQGACSWTQAKCMTNFLRDLQGDTRLLRNSLLLLAP